MLPAPLVAVAPYRLAAGRVTDWTDSAEAVPGAYLRALRRAGALTAVVGAPEGVAAGDLLAPFDALLLVGGGDVARPAEAGPAHPAVYGVDPGRDRFEMDLVRAALALGLPLLAVCRGVQVLDVALGGTLHQHLPDLGIGVTHGVPVASGEAALHPVDVVAGSRLAAVADASGRLASCVSIHHQGIDRVGEGLVVTGRSPDGLVEAVEAPPERPWLLGVQWHPERSADADPQQQAIFDELVAAAGRRHG